ncbi:hypothetical protein ACSFA0_14660 [Variovorax sp. LT1P1]|uniref:hypothetical protein n=1 Tax=Variovorax sp. LT1P1 TaxID=3443730 RepID=UPI003F48CA54
MTNIACVPEAEIVCLARKEVHAGIDGLKKTSAQHRALIAALRREVESSKKQVKLFERDAARARTVPMGVESSDQDGQPAQRFSATRLAARRAKLALSTADYGKLVGVSGQTICNWMQGSARPRPPQLQAPTAVRGISRKRSRSTSACQPVNARG